MGNYAEHPSACDPQRFASRRPACWGERWCCPGTRQADDPQRREKWLCTWTAKGGCCWLHNVSESTDNVAFDWLSWRRPAAAGALAARRPSEPAAAGAAANRHAARAGGARLVRPAAHRPDNVAESDVTEESDAEAAGTNVGPQPTKRRRRLARAARAYWRFRKWVENEAEAATHSASPRRRCVDTCPAFHDAPVPQPCNARCMRA